MDSKSEEIRKALRKEQYLLEKQNIQKFLHYGTEDELYKMCPYGIYDYRKQEQEYQYRKILFQAMHLALLDLKALNPYWHELVCEFYLRKDKITLEQLGEMHGITRQAVTKSFKRAMNVLKQIAEEYLEQLIQ